MKSSDDYYHKRYLDIIEVIDKFYGRVMELSKQTSFLTKVDFLFDIYHYRAERSRFVRKYFSHVNR
jgi:hypothetical protein